MCHVATKLLSFDSEQDRLKPSKILVSLEHDSIYHYKQYFRSMGSIFALVIAPPTVKVPTQGMLK